MSKFLVIIVLVVAIVGGGWYAWLKGYVPFPASKGNTHVAEIQKKGVLVVGTDATYPPLEFIDEKNHIVGFDADLAAEVAKDMNVTLDLRNISFDTLFNALKNGEVDLVISSVTITTERQKEMLFSSPYFNAGQVIVTRSDNQTISDTSSLKDKKVGVQKETTSQTEAGKYTTLVKAYADYGPAKDDLIAGNIDAIIIDYPAGVSMAQSNEGVLQVVGNPFTSEFYGVVAPLGKENVVDAVNATIIRLKTSGRLSELENLWFKR